MFFTFISERCNDVLFWLNYSDFFLPTRAASAAAWFTSSFTPRRVALNQKRYILAPCSRPHKNQYFRAVFKQVFSALLFAIVCKIFSLLMIRINQYCMLRKFTRCCLSNFVISTFDEKCICTKRRVDDMQSTINLRPISTVSFSTDTIERSVVT